MINGCAPLTLSSAECVPSKDKPQTKCFSPVVDYPKDSRLHRPDIEPGPPAWQASILPLNQRCCHTNSLSWETRHQTKIQPTRETDDEDQPLEITWEHWPIILWAKHVMLSQTAQQRRQFSVSDFQAQRVPDKKQRLKNPTHHCRAVLNPRVIELKWEHWPIILWAKNVMFSPTVQHWRP